MIKISEELNLEGYTLILPSLAVGNVGQLSIDLLISSLDLHVIGQILSSAFVPVVGLDPYDNSSKVLCTAIDVYASTKNKIVAIQIRSPYISDLTEFFIELKQFIVDQKIVKVVILSSSYDYEKEHVQPDVAKLRYVPSTDLSSKDKTQFEDLNWVQHKPKPIPYRQNETVLHIPGGGFAINLYNFLSHSKIECVILFKFCSEGDNIADAVDLITYMNQWIKLLDINADGGLKCKFPPSWKYLFGNPPASEIY
ncbi:hypothetical protein KM043_012866 [Ampulex compressa]|nr:hypothetical protein KM043_012866 [Ampulex compressa]